MHIFFRWIVLFRARCFGGKTSQNSSHWSATCVIKGAQLYA